MYYIGTRPRGGGRRFRMEASNECGIIFLSYHMLPFTSWIHNQELQFVLGYSFTATIGYVLISNVLSMLYTQYLAQVSSWRKFRNQRAYEKRFAEYKSVERISYMMRCGDHRQKYYDIKEHQMDKITR
jgi:hypothetical protein